MAGSKDSDPTLPLPVSNQRTRFVSPGRSHLRVRWAKIKRQLGNGSAPDDSLGDPTMTDTTSDSGSVFARKNAAGQDNNPTGKQDTDIVDEVVVDNAASPEFWTKPLAGTGLSDHAGGSHTSPGTGTGMIGTNYQSEASSMRNTAFESTGVFNSVVNFVRWRTWPVIQHFFNPAYHDKALEEAFQKEQWFTQKSTHIFGACFLVFNWVLSIALLPRPWSDWNKVLNYGIGPALSIPTVLMACLDFPRKQFYVWQIWLWCTIWIFATGNIIDMRLCHYYVPALKACGNKDFQGTLYYTSALPVIGLFALGQTRFFMALLSLVWIIIVAALILTQRISFIRNVLNIALFHGFVLYTHYRRDLADRRMYTMRAELKVQFRSRQKAQINERKTMDSKRRFSSYIFHEVRVPLNSSLLAVQNLEAAGVFDKNSDLAVEYQALSGSLSMMSQVLNDVLDFTRMEKGGFSSVSRPMALHAVMRSIFMPLRLDANARGLSLETSLDPRIDEVARSAAFSDEERLEDSVLEADGLVMGDEMRLRQVINNLATNACKFTAAGGTITITTQLIYPTDISEKARLSTGDSSSSSAPGKMVRSLSSDVGPNGVATYTPRLSTNRLQEHEAKVCPPSKDILVVRFEIKDTGVGIRPRDMAENRLFSAYVQTEIGRNQGGKGTGLGLSLVRQIVMLSGGRLGVKSRAGEGSTFWVEMPFNIGPQTRHSDGLDFPKPLSPPSSNGKGTSNGSSSSDQTSPASSEFQFMPAVTRRRASEAAVNMSSIREASATGAAIELVPVNFRFISPPATPDGGPPPASILSPPSNFPINEMVPVPAVTSALNPSTIASLLKRPEISSHISSSSAPPTISPPVAGQQKPKSQTMDFKDGPLRVLVVDDDTLTRTLMSRMLARLGCTVSSAENGAIALEMLLKEAAGEDESAGPTGVDPRSWRKKNYDITFLDNQMPVASGLEVVHRLRSLARDDLVIGVTANALLSDQDQYIEAGASAVLTKPVLEKDLRRYLVMADNLRTQSKDPKYLENFPKPAYPPPLLLRTDSDG